MAFEELEILSSAFPNIPIWVVVLLIVWTLIWKGFALWKSARLNQPIWFVLLLVINTAGILEIIYISIFSEINKKISSQPIKKIKSAKPKRKKK